MWCANGIIRLVFLEVGEGIGEPDVFREELGAGAVLLLWDYGEESSTEFNGSDGGTSDDDCVRISGSLGVLGVGGFCVDWIIVRLSCDH